MKYLLIKLHGQYETPIIYPDQSPLHRHSKLQLALDDWANVQTVFYPAEVY